MSYLLEEAKKQLNLALTSLVRSTPEPLPEGLSDKVKVIIGDREAGSVTLKYILITALLAKSSDESLDVFSLQKGDASPGSYDARSLCHKVLVKYEQSQPLDLWGRSNEPFANQTARHPNIKESPARRSDLHSVLIDILTIVSSLSAENARKVLRYGLSYSIQRATEVSDPGVYSQASTVSRLLTFVKGQGFGGASLSAFVATCCSFIYPRTTIEVSRKNTADSAAGISGDIVVRDQDKVILVVESKDRVVNSNDVTHAIRKARAHECSFAIVSTKVHKASVKAGVLDASILAQLASAALELSEDKDVCSRFERFLTVASTTPSWSSLDVPPEVAQFRRWMTR